MDVSWSPTFCLVPFAISTFWQASDRDATRAGYSDMISQRVLVCHSCLRLVPPDGGRCPECGVSVNPADRGQSLIEFQNEQTQLRKKGGYPQLTTTEYRERKAWLDSLGFIARSPRRALLITGSRVGASVMSATGLLAAVLLYDYGSSEGVPILAGFALAIPVAPFTGWLAIRGCAPLRRGFWSMLSGLAMGVGSGFGLLFWIVLAGMPVDAAAFFISVFIVLIVGFGLRRIVRIRRGLRQQRHA